MYCYGLPCINARTIYKLYISESLPELCPASKQPRFLSSHSLPGKWYLESGILVSELLSRSRTAMSTAALFEPLKLGSLVLKNKIIMSAMTRNRAVPTNIPNDFIVSAVSVMC